MFWSAMLIGMNSEQSLAPSMTFYEVVADCFVSGRSFLRGETASAEELGDLKYVLSAAGLIRKVEKQEF